LRRSNALRREVLEGARDRMAAQYYAKYFEKNRFRPIVQLAMLAGGLGYAVHYYAVGREWRRPGARRWRGVAWRRGAATDARARSLAGHYHKTRKYH
jgi:hypothetical protein